jgi:hypothetical protein
MRYLKVRWTHSHPNEPVTLYSEIDEAGWEVRKVEVFRHGEYGYSSASGSIGSTRLSLEPLPSLSKIAAQPQFEPSEIAPEEFEEVWSKAKAYGRDTPAR